MFQALKKIQQNQYYFLNPNFFNNNKGENNNLINNNIFEENKNGEGDEKIIHIKNLRIGLLPWSFNFSHSFVH